MTDKEKIDSLEAKVCEMREALKLAQLIYDSENSEKCSKYEKALSNTSTCPHKAELEAAQSRVAELEAAQKRLDLSQTIELLILLRIEFAQSNPLEMWKIQNEIERLKSIYAAMKGTK